MLLVLLCACGGRQASQGLTIAVIPNGHHARILEVDPSRAVKAAREEGAELVWKGPQKEDDRAQQIALVEDIGGLVANLQQVKPLRGERGPTVASGLADLGVLQFARIAQGLVRVVALCGT